MTQEEHQEELNKMWASRRDRKKCHFVLGPKFEQFGQRLRRSISDGIEFKAVGRAKNKNPRYVAQLVLGDEK